MVRIMIAINEIIPLLTKVVHLALLFVWIDGMCRIISAPQIEFRESIFRGIILTIFIMIAFILVTSIIGK